MHIKDAIATKQNVTLWANWRYRGSRYKWSKLYRTDLHKVFRQPAGQSGNCPPPKFSQTYVFVRCSNNCCNL